MIESVGETAALRRCVISRGCDSGGVGTEVLVGARDREGAAVSVLSFVVSDVRFGVSVGRELWIASGFRSVVFAWRFCGRLMKLRG